MAIKELTCDECEKVTTDTCPECHNTPLCATCAEQFGTCDACEQENEGGDDDDNE